MIGVLFDIVKLQRTSWLCLIAPNEMSRDRMAERRNLYPAFTKWGVALRLSKETKARIVKGLIWLHAAGKRRRP
jgi:hypothetical protein